MQIQSSDFFSPGGTASLPDEKGSTGPEGGFLHAWAELKKLPDLPRFQELVCFQILNTKDFKNLGFKNLVILWAK